MDLSSREMGPGGRNNIHDLEKEQRTNAKKPCIVYSDAKVPTYTRPIQLGPVVERLRSSNSLLVNASAAAPIVSIYVCISSLFARPIY